MIPQSQKFNFSKVMSKTCIQAWWKQMLESGFVGWGVSSSLNCFLEAGVSQRAAGVSVRPPPFLSDALSLLSQLWLVIWGALDTFVLRTRLQLSLFTGGLLCVFKCFQLQFIGNSIYYVATLKMLIIQGNVSKVSVFHLPQDTWEAGSDPQQTWGEEREEQIFTQPS